MLLLEKSRRLSTDIDIIVKPGTDVQSYLEQAGEIYPFRSMEQQIRTGRNKIDKAHYKFIYDSPGMNTSFHILLDILFEENHYCTLVKRKVDHPFLRTEEPYVEVTMPSVNCILGDKLTAFAPIRPVFRSVWTRSWKSLSSCMIYLFLWMPTTIWMMYIPPTLQQSKQNWHTEGFQSLPNGYCRTPSMPQSVLPAGDIIPVMSIPCICKALEVLSAISTENDSVLTKRFCLLAKPCTWLHAC